VRSNSKVTGAEKSARMALAGHAGMGERSVREGAEMIEPAGIGGGFGGSEAGQ
jgi:hypothetical protein